VIILKDVGLRSIAIPLVHLIKPGSSGQVQEQQEHLRASLCMMATPSPSLPKPRMQSQTCNPCSFWILEMGHQL
jgi:hypothetical protein